VQKREKHRLDSVACMSACMGKTESGVAIQGLRGNAQRAGRAWWLRKDRVRSCGSAWCVVQWCDGVNAGGKLGAG